MMHSTKKGKHQNKNGAGGYRLERLRYSSTFHKDYQVLAVLANHKIQLYTRINTRMIARLFAGVDTKCQVSSREEPSNTRAGTFPHKDVAIYDTRIWLNTNNPHSWFRPPTRATAGNVEGKVDVSVSAQNARRGFDVRCIFLPCFSFFFCGYCSSFVFLCSFAIVGEKVGIQLRDFSGRELQRPLYTLKFIFETGDKPNVGLRYADSSFMEYQNPYYRKTN